MEEKLGDVIIRERLKREMSLQTLGKIINVEPGYISRIERNLRVPSPTTLKKLSNTLELDYENLLILSNKIDYLYDIKLIKKAYILMNKDKRIEMIKVLSETFNEEFENAKNTLDKES